MKSEISLDEKEVKDAIREYISKTTGVPITCVGAIKLECMDMLNEVEIEPYSIPTFNCAKAEITFNPKAAYPFEIKKEENKGHTVEKPLRLW